MENLHILENLSLLLEFHSIFKVERQSEKPYGERKDGKKDIDKKSSVKFIDQIFGRHFLTFRGEILSKVRKTLTKCHSNQVENQKTS